MFRENTSHLQGSLLGITGNLSESKLKRLRKSKEYEFYRLIFCNIKEKDFAVLFSGGYSRPNAPVNTLVSSIILQHHNGWSIRELFDRIDFDILTRTALGLDDINGTPFCEATYFNFQKRILSHYLRTGESLIEGVFEGLTAMQLKALKIKTDIQRSDSFMAMSNIRSYGRTQLLVEILIRLNRVLCDEDKVRFTGILSPYTKQDSEGYVYELNRDRIPHELKRLGQVYHELYGELKSRYCDTDEFGIFERVYREHFKVRKNRVCVRDASKLPGSVLQSPDDIDATCRRKGGRQFRGQSVNVTETASPENNLNLITDVSVNPNVTDDSTVLAQRLEGLKDKTPDLKELHTDAAYGSEENDMKMEELEITHVQTAVRGRTAVVSMEIEEVAEGEYHVRCPYQKKTAQKTRQGYKACFDLRICETCRFSGKCCTVKQKGSRVYYFDRGDYLKRKRNSNMDKIPPERRKLRPNIEATVKEFTRCFNHRGKLKVRGKFKTMIYAFAMGIAINFGRIWRYMRGNPDYFTLSGRLSRLFHVIFNGENTFWHRGKIIPVKITDFSYIECYYVKTA